MTIVKTILKTVLLLLLPFLIVCSTEEEAKEETTEQNTASPNKDKEDRCKNRTERQVSCSNKTKEEPEEHTYTFRFKPTYVTYYKCWPKQSTQTTLIKPENSTWSTFLPGIFDININQEWKKLNDSWNSNDNNYYSYSDRVKNFSGCKDAESGATSMEEVFIDFHIKSRQALPAPIPINFTYHIIDTTGEIYERTIIPDINGTHLIRSRAQLETLWSPIRNQSRSKRYIQSIYYNTDFSKKTLLLLQTAVKGSSVGFLVSAYNSLLAIYEWNEKLYIIKKDGIIYSLGSLFGFPPGFFTFIITLDYAKDLPVEWIKIP